MFKVKTKVLACSAFLFIGIQTFGQCAMCRAVLESEDGQSTAAGVNNGIMYLMSIPYLLVAAIGVIIYFQFFRPKNNVN